MAKVNFSIKAKKYQMEFLDNKVKIMDLSSKNKVIIPKETKVKNFINYILSIELK